MTDDNKKIIITREDVKEHLKPDSKIVVPASLILIACASVLLVIAHTTPSSIMRWIGFIFGGMILIPTVIILVECILAVFGVTRRFIMARDTIIRIRERNMEFRPMGLSKTARLARIFYKPTILYFSKCGKFRVPDTYMNGSEGFVDMAGYAVNAAAGDKFFIVLRGRHIAAVYNCKTYDYVGHFFDA